MDDRLRSKIRWINAPPTPDDATWSLALSGDPFIEKVSQYAGFSPEKVVLEDICGI